MKLCTKTQYARAAAEIAAKRKNAAKLKPGVTILEPVKTYPCPQCGAFHLSRIVLSEPRIWKPRHTASV